MGVRRHAAYTDRRRARRLAPPENRRPPPPSPVHSHRARNRLPLCCRDGLAADAPFIGRNSTVSFKEFRPGRSKAIEKACCFSTTTPPVNLANLAAGVDELLSGDEFFVTREEP